MWRQGDASVGSGPLEGFHEMRDLILDLRLVLHRLGHFLGDGADLHADAAVAAFLEDLRTHVAKKSAEELKSLL